MQGVESAQPQVVDLETRERRAAGDRQPRFVDVNRQRARHAGGDFILDRKKLAGPCIVPAGPQLTSRRPVNELDCDANRVALAPDAPAEDVRGNRRCRSLGAGPAGEHERFNRSRVENFQRSEARKLGRQILDESAGEVILARVA